MKVTHGECFILENGLQGAVNELRESKVKNLLLNVIVSRNLQKIGELCNTFRKEIQEFMPDGLRELNELKDEISDEDKVKRDELSGEYNKAINEFLSQSCDVEFFKPSISIEALNGVETSYDVSTIIGLILLETEKK